MVSVYAEKIKSKKTGKVTVRWYVGYYQDGKHSLSVKIFQLLAVPVT